MDRRANSKAEIIMDHLIDQIKSGSLKPNDKIPSERGLAKDFETSRATVREAIQSLAAKKYILISQGKQSIVNDYLADEVQSPMAEMMSKDDKLVQDVMAVRHLLETEATKLSAQNRNQQQLDIIEKAHIELQQTDFSDYQKFAQADRNFHLAIADACGNLAIAQMMRSIENLLFDHILKSLVIIADQQDCYEQIQAQHQNIMDQIASHKTEEAKLAAAAHLSYVSKLINK